MGGKARSQSRRAAVADWERAVTLDDFEEMARRRLPKPIYDYIAGGSFDERSLRLDREVYDRFVFMPRCLVDVSKVSLATKVLGREVASPVLLAPTATHKLVHPQGELATARAASRAQTIFCVSSLSSYSIEDVAATGAGRRWFQLYCFGDRALTTAMVRRAEAAGYEALCLTVDVPRLGPRERDVRNHLELPADVTAANYVGENGLFRDGSARTAFERFAASMASDITWADLEWLCSSTRLPVVVKGVLCAEDARLAFENGARAVIVSSHGGRQLDGSLPPLLALREIRDVLGSGPELFVDGGVRRGSQVVTALALGANAVLIGRPYVWALAVGGEGGVLETLTMLRSEVETCFALLGCAAREDLSRTHVLEL